MKICKQCEFENDDSREFCLMCGAKLEENITEEEKDQNTDTSDVPVNEEEEEVTSAIEEFAAQDIGITDDTDENTADVSQINDADSNSTQEEYTEETDETYNTDVNSGFESMDNNDTIEEPPLKKPLSKKTAVCIAVIVALIAAAILFYCFGSLGLLSKIGIINTPRYISVVKNRQIQETENAPSVKTADAFDAFFKTDSTPVSWTANKTPEGVTVKAEVVCKFDGQENTVATYNANLNFDGSIASEAFLAADKTLDEDQTLSVLQKTARYSDPAKKDFTTKELSSSKYNNREYYYPYGVTLSNIAGGNIESFIQTYGMPEDVEGNTDVAVLNGLIKGDIYAKLMGITFDELKTQFGLDESITPDMRWAQIQDEIVIGNYGLNDENFAEFKESYGFGDDVTLDTKYKDIKYRMIKFQYDELEKQKQDNQSEADAPSEPTDGVADSNTPAENAEAADDTNATTEPSAEEAAPAA